MHLIHKKISDGLWAWVCPICSKEFRHRTDGLNRWTNIQSKGAASRHLGSHDKDLVDHGKSIEECSRPNYKGQLYIGFD